MRFFVSVILAFILVGCSTNYTRDALEGTWESKDSAWAPHRMIFRNDTMIMYHPSDTHDSALTALFDQRMEFSPYNQYKYEIVGDTLRYESYENRIFPPGKRMLRGFFYIKKLTDDSLHIGIDKESTDILKHIRIK